MVHGFNIDEEVRRQAKKDVYTTVTQVDCISSDKTGQAIQSAAKAWKPITLRLPYLSSLVLITLALIAIIQWLLFRSRADQGILSAPNINKLPLRTSFLYLYLPTIISVIYSFLWTWVDLDVKRLEPYFQLSKTGGATADHSILLHYPFDFLASVPLKAVRRKHWSVFATSMIMVLVFWGLTPIQAGIFAVRTVAVHESMPLHRARSYVPTTQQGDPSAIYPQSAYNIAWLNETLPPYMTREYILAAFGPDAGPEPSAGDLSYTGVTTKYGVDLTCEVPIPSTSMYGEIVSNSSTGCSFLNPTLKEMPANDTSKPYQITYAGHIAIDGYADWYIWDYCKDTFWVRWSKSSSGSATPVRSTSVFCTSYYYQQEVNATVTATHKQVLNVVPLSPKAPLPLDLFNTTIFEWAMGTGNVNMTARSPYPLPGFPRQESRLQIYPIDLEDMVTMAPFAIAVDPRPMDDYFDPDTLHSAYQAVYRLLFARRLADVLKSDLDLSQADSGIRAYSTQAVVVVPGFAWAATGLLAAVLALATWLISSSIRRSNMLQCDPGSIAALMDLVCSSLPLTKTLANFNRSSATTLHAALVGKPLVLNPRSDLDGQGRSKFSISLLDDSPVLDEQYRVRDMSAGVRPMELRALTGMIFLACQLGALGACVVLYASASLNNGIVMPSQSTIVRQLLENYLPIAVATLLEPFWLVLNRQICMLQPWEELRKGDAPAAKSIELNYNSLPPQFVIWKALTARHLQLALICLATILAIGLAVALGGLMYEDLTTVSTPAQFTSQYRVEIKALNGTGIAYNYDGTTASLGQNGLDQFYYAMSNSTAGTPLPSWTDGGWLYLPVSLPEVEPATTFVVATTAFGVTVDCQPLQSAATTYTLEFADTLDWTLNVNISVPDGSIQTCTNTSVNQMAGRILGYGYDARVGQAALEIDVVLGSTHSDADDLACRQYVVVGWLRAELVQGKLLQNIGTNTFYSALHPTSRTETMMLCAAAAYSREATVIVAADGHVQRTEFATTSSRVPLANSQDLVAQMNTYRVAANRGHWHADNYPSDFDNYLLHQVPGTSQLLNTSAPVPSYDVVAPGFEAVYARLVATMLSLGVADLFAAADNSTPPNRGSIRTMETRIFVSLPAFAVSAGILVLYIFTTIWLYARRPWRILPRLPTTIASTIAYFAASRGVRERDLAHDAGIQSSRWAFGEYVGVDGETHVGVEMEPLVQVRSAFQQQWSRADFRRRFHRAAT
ncbi:hypothetical protein B0A48_00849 [Cryoendolithus antarcticus]|uniref:Uncharacterized protein n=1 Tax=Cryoendolithus antarcticus TaxID=1507870 RepID=A0A1V8TRQ7_9PEZI|nr:hypothetical protein B0A48_00849 [Cryoendolithus antarcticus]